VSALIDSAIAQARLIAAGYRPDRYEVLRTVATSDGQGGSTTVESVVEAGGCILTAGNLRPEELTIAARSEAQAPYVARNMPHQSGVTARDVVRIAGRRFEVAGVLRTSATSANRNSKRTTARRSTANTSIGVSPS
jgi:hypothetical protein